MLYMLDIDISSYIIKRRPAEVLERLEWGADGDVCISVVTLAELLYGVDRSLSPGCERWCSVEVREPTRHPPVGPVRG